MYKLNGQVPETIILGQTSDISFICSFAWYNWFYYNEQNAPFPTSKMTLGRYLGPTDPEAGSVISAKILTYEGNMIRCNTLRHLTPIENESTELITAKSNFTINQEAIVRTLQWVTMAHLRRCIVRIIISIFLPFWLWNL
jgi:hypothetical protein